MIKIPLALSIHPRASPLDATVKQTNTEKSVVSPFTVNRTTERRRYTKDKNPPAALLEWNQQLVPTKNKTMQNRIHKFDTHQCTLPRPGVKKM